MIDEPQEETLELDLPKPKVKRRREGEHKAKEVTGVRWAKYSAVNRYLCDRCIKGIHDGTKMVAPNRAAYKRTQGTTTEYLCFPHTQEQRAADGLATYKR